MLTAAAAVLILAWLPGAVLYRLPFWDRAQRAALPAEERIFWQINLSAIVSLAVTIALAAAGRYSFGRILAANLLLSIVLVALARFDVRLRAQGPRLSALIPIALVLVGLWRFFPSAEYVMGGKDPGTYVGEGMLIAQRGTLVYEDPIVAGVPPFARDLFFPYYERAEYYSTRFMGFFIQDPDRGTVVGQFPHALPASLALAYGIDGLSGMRHVFGWWAILGVLAVYFTAARLAGIRIAAIAALLLATHVVQVWYARYPNTEVVAQALLFAALLANARAHVDGDRFFAPVAGALLGLLLFLRFDSVLAIAAVMLANVVGVLRGHKIFPSFVAVVVLVGAAAAWYLAGPMWAYGAYPFHFIRNLPWWQHALLAAVALIAIAVLFSGGRGRLRASESLLNALPVVMATVVAGLAVYALFLREPGGRLAVHDAYALRMYAAFYVGLPAIGAALLGYFIIARGLFWRDPALMVTLTLFALFFFFKIRIVPEHFWAARRWLPAILPGTLILVSIAAMAGLSQRSRTRRIISGAVGFVFLALLATQYARAARPVLEHVEYAGMIPQLEKLAGSIGDRDLLIVESRDAGSDDHVFALPLAYIYARNVLLLASARPERTMFNGFLEWAETKYERVLFLGGGGTDVLSSSWTAVPVATQRFEVPEYESPVNAYPRTIKQKKFNFGLYEFRPRAGNEGLWFDLDIGSGDDLHLLRFHAKEQADGRSMRWSQRQSFIVVTTMPEDARTVVLTLSNGGRPEAAAPAEVTVFFEDRALGTLQVGPGFRDYSLSVPEDLARSLSAKTDPPRLRLVSTLWNPSKTLGVGDDRELGVMVDRVQVR